MLKRIWQEVALWVQFALGATVAIACLACATIVTTPANAAGAVHGARGGAVALPALPASLKFTGGSRRIPASFFGLSVEYKELGTYERSGQLFDRFISLIRPRDGRPMLLRIGGKSADHVWWQSATETPPIWVSKLGDSWLDNLNELVRRDDLRVMLDLNLAVHSSTLAANFASAAVKLLPRSAVAGLEVGNEPDLYWRQPQLEQQRIQSTGRNVPLRWTANYSPLEYRQDYQAYARALAAAVPGIPLGAPEIISSKPSWLAAVTGLGRLLPGFIAIHRYASSTCWPATSPYYPTISRLLNESSSAGLARTVEGAVTFAHSNHMALRLTEINSVSCGGNLGVTNSFATALWTPDTLFEMIRAGVDAINWHIRPATVNAPFNLNSRGIEPLPELYGLAVFAQMTHGPASLLDSTLVSSAGLHVKAWAVAKGAASTVLLINKGVRETNVSVPAGAAKAGVATVRRLQAPRIGSTTGLRYAGRWIGPDARWHGREIATPVHESGGFYHVLVPGYSAATVTLRR